MKLKGTHKRPRTGVPSCIMRSKRFAFGDGVLGGDGANGVVDGEKDADADEAEVEAAAGGTKRVEDPPGNPPNCKHDLTPERRPAESSV